MDAGGYVRSLRRQPPSKEQAANLRGLADIGDRFHRECGIGEYNSTGTLVIESGHQPNFMPHAGVWRKVFLLDRLARSAPDTIAVFGFADYNISTAPILHHGRVPDHSRDGFVRTGFSIGGGDRWKRFDSLPKPERQALDRQLQDIRSMYERNARLAGADWGGISGNIAGLNSILGDCHGRAKTFADMNAFFFARVCTELLGLRVLFFRYSDVQRENLFAEAAWRLAERSGEFASACNSSVEKRGLAGELGRAEDYFFPFWLHCGCGGKVTLSLHGGLVQGRCPVCEKGHGFALADFRAHYPDLAPTAVARNLVFSEGLCTTLFVSGSGGGLRYGAVANDAADALGVHKPATLAWRGRDFYLGAAHKVALDSLAKALGVSAHQLLESDAPALVSARRRELDSHLHGAPDSDKKARQRIEGQLRNIETQTSIASAVYSTMPSAYDVYANVGAEEAVKAWDDALACREPDDGEFITLTQDIVYHPDAPAAYERITALK